MTDQQLLKEYTQRQSNDAMCQLISRHIGMVHAAATRELKDSHLADDAAQAVFLILLRRAPSLSQNVCVGGWLFNVTRLVAAEARRGQSRRLRREREAAAMQPQSVSPPREPEFSEIAPFLNEALGALSQADRDALVLRHLENKPIQEVALLLGTSENTARQRVFRALERLRKQLSRRRQFIATAALGVALDQSPAHAAPANLMQGLQNVITSSALPAHASSALAKGALHMMWKGKVAILGGSVAAAVAVVAGMSIAIASTHSSPQTAPAASLASATGAATQPLTVQAVNQLFAGDPANTDTRTDYLVKVEFTGTAGAAFHGTIELNSGGTLKIADTLPQTLLVRGAKRIVVDKDRREDAVDAVFTHPNKSTANGSLGRAGSMQRVTFTCDANNFQIDTKSY